MVKYDPALRKMERSAPATPKPVASAYATALVSPMPIQMQMARPSAIMFSSVNWIQSIEKSRKGICRARLTISPFVERPSPHSTHPAISRITRPLDDSSASFHSTPEARLSPVSNEPGAQLLRFPDEKPAQPGGGCATQAGTSQGNSTGHRNGLRFIYLRSAMGATDGFDFCGFLIG